MCDRPKYVYKVIILPIFKILDKDYKQLYSLNFRYQSPMRKALVKYKKHPDARVFMIKDGEIIRGWSLVTPGRLNGQIRASFYVRHAYRRKGVGSALCGAVDGYASESGVMWGYFPHDATAKSFFAKHPSKNAFTVYETPGLYKYWDGSKWRYPSPFHRPK